MHSSQFLARYTSTDSPLEAQIIHTQISVLITQLNHSSFSIIENRFKTLLNKSPFSVYVNYWKKHLRLAAAHIKEHSELNTEGNVLHRLLDSLFEDLKTKTNETLQQLRAEIFENQDFLTQADLPIDDIIKIFENRKDNDIISRIRPATAIKRLKKLQNSKMNTLQTLQQFLTDQLPSTFESNLSSLLCSLEGESLNDMVALILAEVLSPGQNIQSNSSSWLTPTAIGEAVERGGQICTALTKLGPSTIDWNRVFNLMSTKYFLNRAVDITLASVNSLFAALNNGPLIDQFLSRDWSIQIKLIICILLHKWSLQQGCVDLLKMPGIKPVSDTVSNTKDSLVYLLSVAKLDIEIFLLREELSSNPMLSLFQENFFEDYHAVPEYLSLALLSDKKHFSLLIDNRPIINELLITLLVQVFERSPASFRLLVRQVKFDVLVDAGRIIIKKETTPLEAFMKVLLDEKLLERFILSISFKEALRIAPSARKVGWSGLEDFIKSNASPENMPAILDFLDLQSKMDDVNTPFRSSKTFDLPAMHFMISFLSSYSLSYEERKQLEDIEFALLITFPRLINFGFGHDKTILANGDLVPISMDVEKEMQSYLQRMYSGELAIKDVIEVLITLRDSDDPHDQDLFACMAHAVIAESNFFRDYPLEALATTSVLFGSMILFQLLRGPVLDVAFKIILNFAKEGPESKMFKFSVQALYAFRMRLKEFPQYCKQLIREVPTLQSQPQIFQTLSQAASQSTENVATKPEQFQQAPELVSLKYFTITEVPPRVVQESPPREVTEKVLFGVNNITEDNFNEKITDLQAVLTENHYSWFSNYLVNQRAKTEPNYHSLYAKILQHFDSKLLYDYILNTTYKQLFLLLSIKFPQSAEKSHLKNLGLWLGNVTLALDRPIGHTNISFREVLLDAHRNDRLETVVPFVTRVLQSAAKSKVFRPPNPWTVGILKVLLELYCKANWKLALTFEVEVLFKAMNIKLEELEPSSFLSLTDAPEILSGNLGTLSAEQQQTEQQQQLVVMQQYQQQLLLMQHRQQQHHQQPQPQPQQQQQQQPQQQQQQQQQKRTVSSSLPHVTDLNSVDVTSAENPFGTLSGQTIFVSHPDLKRVFQMAIAKSVREILVPVADKSSSVAVVVTFNVILKDFATEPDEVKLKSAAISMVRHLSRSFARATSVDLLRDTIRSTTQSLAPNLMSLPNSPIDELNAAINDNMGIALAIIEKASMDKATQDISEQLMQAIAVRKYHKERRSDQLFLAQNYNSYSLSLPEPLGLKPSGVTAQQLKIYEEFGQSFSRSESAATLPGSLIGANSTQQASLNQPLPQHQAVQQQLQQQQALKFEQENQQKQEVQHQQQQNLLLRQLQQSQSQSQLGSSLPIVQAPPNVQNELEQNHRILVLLMDNLVDQIKESSDQQLQGTAQQKSIKDIISQILNFILRSNQKDQLALKVSQAVVNSLFATSESPLCRDVLSLLLEKLCSLSVVARKDVVWWLVYALDSRKFNVPVIHSLLDVNLISTSELDSVLVVAMRSSMENAMSFAISLIEELILSDEPLFMRSDFVKTLTYLKNSSEENAVAFFDKYDDAKILPVKKSARITKAEKTALVFTEWVKLIQRLDGDDETVLEFIRQMIEKGVLQDSNGFICFMKSALELSVNSFKESDPTSEVFIAIDSLSKLLIKLICLLDFKQSSREEFLSLMFSVVTLVFSEDQGRNDTSFNERPYFRLFSSLLCDWEALRGHKFVKIKDPACRKELVNFDESFYNIFASFLHVYQPIAFPGFAFAWITLLSHRMFLPRMLRLPNKAGWSKLLLLFTDLLNFMAHYTKRTETHDAVTVVYKGALRVILAVSNDVPEFLVENHYELLNNIPPIYMQLRNIILSSAPTKVVIPDPYDPNIELHDIEACQVPAAIFYDPVQDLKGLKKPVDNYLRIPSSSLMRTILSGLFRTELELDTGIGYETTNVDVKLINAITLHVGIEAALEKDRTSANAIFNTKSSYFTLFKGLITEGSTELKFHVIQAIANQLRYPNAHTLWFNYVIKNLFYSDEFEEQQHDVQEIIIRTVLERIITNKPHCWGIVVTFVDILKSDSSSLADLSFIKDVPEIELIIKNLSKHIIPHVRTKGMYSQNGEGHEQFPELRAEA
ncbi:LAMI_0A00760g1_1 [Lachancea mirantina]|uniref:LAMI_0A00760g1_1 n=1 Tax=Lachancea mirantina TaxID=1230905 RepID=A0A1G4ILQ4_9SACH|nr:LAMI_0A00760g1_1 [Lachancea mirantina]